MTTVLRFAALFLIALTLSASAKSWQTGKVLNAGPATAVTGVDSTDSIIFIPDKVAWDAYVLQANGHVYLCRERRAVDKEPAVMTVGAQVSFYVRANMLVFKDEAGKRHKAFLVTDSN